VKEIETLCLNVRYSVWLRAVTFEVYRIFCTICARSGSRVNASPFQRHSDIFTRCERKRMSDSLCMCPCVRVRVSVCPCVRVSVCACESIHCAVCKHIFCTDCLVQILESQLATKFGVCVSSLLNLPYSIFTFDVQTNFQRLVFKKNLWRNLQFCTPTKNEFSHTSNQ